MVRLKLTIPPKGGNGPLGLNSTMVRLKLKPLDFSPTADELSQFHYGSIKTPLYHLFIGWSAPSQFHYGSIKTILDELAQFCRKKSQFHYGSIKTYVVKDSQNPNDESQFHYGSIKT